MAEVTAEGKARGLWDMEMSVWDLGFEEEAGTRRAVAGRQDRLPGEAL